MENTINIRKIENVSCYFPVLFSYVIQTTSIVLNVCKIKMCLLFSNVVLFPALTQQ